MILKKHDSFVQSRLFSLESNEPSSFQTSLRETLHGLRDVKAIEVITTIVMIDLDDFKHINDTYGHQEGDQVLMRISGLIHEAIRKLNINASDGRWGGEEFMLMLPGMTREAAAVFAEEIRQEIEKLRFENAEKYLPVLA